MTSSKAKKARLDVRLVELGLAESRERAQRLIRAGLVEVPGRVLDKPGMLVSEDAQISVRGPDHPYVSRGGVKLAGALDAFTHDPRGETAIDIGASTGGFTDCLLQRGAARVVAVDVGRGQLHHRIATDIRVDAHEQTHLDEITPELVGRPVDLAVVDVSFISAARGLEPMKRVLRAGGRAIVLVKPQFEVGRTRVPKGGVVRDAADQRSAVDAVAEAARLAGFEVIAEAASPIAGAEGNAEFFLYLKLPG